MSECRESIGGVNHLVVCHPARGVYPYLGRVAINYWRKGLGGENRGQGFDCHQLQVNGSRAGTY